MNSLFKFTKQKLQTMPMFLSGESDTFRQADGMMKIQFWFSMDFWTALCPGSCMKSSNFSYNFRKKGLPFVLAQAGFDVWVGNNRGTIYSDTNSHNSKYWEFNVDHFSEFDQPALINKVLEETKKEKLIYIGHSQGSTQFLLGMSYHEELQ